MARKPSSRPPSRRREARVEAARLAAEKKAELQAVPAISGTSGNKGGSRYQYYTGENPDLLE